MRRSTRTILFLTMFASIPLLLARVEAAPDPGVIALSVNLAQTPWQHVVRARITMPVRPGALTLYYPKWIPGEHSPAGPINELAGLECFAGGHRIPWVRDPVHLYSFHLVIPKGAHHLVIRLDYLSPVSGGSFTEGISATPHLVDFNWNEALLYPAGSPTREIEYVPTLTVPPGWRFGTALRVLGREGSTIHFRKVPLNTLVDSPVITGAYFRKINLAPGNPVHRTLDIVADYPQALDLSAREIQDYRNLIRQESLMFHSHHYTSYHFLLTLSNHTSHFGLEHHQSSDDRTGADYFLNPKAFLVGADLLPHEYTHSWNGKFRRPAKLWQPNFQIPEQTSLLWVYEGLTQYWGDVMATRSGIWTPRDFREALAMTAANMSHRPGREWRSLEDTATASPYLYYAPGFYATWRRSVDFYPEGELIWLEVDTKIRELSHGVHSLNDFARVFFGMDNGSDVTRTYDVADVVRALNSVQPYHWGRFLKKRLERVGNRAPLSGLKWGGWRLVYTAHPSPYAAAMQSLFHFDDLMFSIGFTVNAKGDVGDVLWKGPAFRAGLAPGMRIQAIDGAGFALPVLARALVAAERSHRPLHLIIEDEGVYRRVAIPYYGGPRYPHLTRIPGTPDYLDAIVHPLP